MAVDKKKTKKFIKEVKAFIPEVIPEKYRDTVMNVLVVPALKELKELVEESRPPTFYLVGRSGHGKSSLINALANKQDAEVGDVKPTTARSKKYSIKFPEQNAEWIVIDSRRLFETTPPKGKTPVNTVERVKKDINKYKPDVILYVISAPEIRNLAHDFEVFSEIMREVKVSLGVEIPVIVVLTKPDTLGNPREEWPPKENDRKAGLILEALEYMAKDVLKAEYEYYDKKPYRGFLLKNSNYIAVIPVCSLWEGKWNIEVLSELIREKLPQMRKNLLKKVSSSLIKRFSAIAAGIGAVSIPISDIFILTPLQILLIAIIGGLSCRPVSEETVAEYLTASGITLGAGVGLRAIARQLVKLIPIPIAGSVISAVIAYVGTYTIGKAAEAYFFEGVVKKPEDFKKEAEEESKQA